MKQSFVLLIVVLIILVIAAPFVFSLTSNEEFLCSVANDTWRYFNASTTSTTASSCYNCTVLGHGFPRGSKDTTDQNAGYNANTADVGFYMASVISAYELGFIDKKTATDRLKQTLDTLYYLQNNNSESYKGLFYQYYNVDNVKPTKLDTTIPSVDNAWLALSLVVTNRFGYERGNFTIENLSITILKNMNLSFLFNEDNKLNQISNNEAGDPTNQFENNTFTHYYNASSGKFSQYFWNIYGDEGRIIAFIARVIEKKSPGYGISPNQLFWYFNTTYHPWLFEEGAYAGIKVKPVSWTGSYFTYSSPGIFLKEFAEFMGKNTTQALLAQMQFAKDKGYAFFGASEATNPSKSKKDFGAFFGSCYRTYFWIADL